MLRNFCVVLCFGSLAFGEGCVLDATGGQENATSSTGHGGASTSVTVGPGPGATTTSASTGQGGAGGSDLCGDGIIEPPETCETGDLVFPSCVNCVIPNMCGNNLIDPGEQCDESSGNCTSCKVTAGACFGVDKLPLTLTPMTATSAGTPMIPGSFDDATPPCGMGPGRTVKVYEFDVGPYPSGLYVSAAGDPAGVADAAIWEYKGCEKTPAQCDDVDPDPLSNMGNPAFLALDNQAPGSVIYVAIGDHNGASGNFDFTALETRLFADFENSSDQFTLGAGWMTSMHALMVMGPAADTTLVSPVIDVVGITDLSIALTDSLSMGAVASVLVTPNVGPQIGPIDIVDTMGMLKTRNVTTPIPAGTKSVKFQLNLASTMNPTWQIHRLMIGPSPT